MRGSAYILVLAALFAAVATGLDAIGFWKTAGLPVPHGYLAQGFIFLTLLFILQNKLFDPYLRVLDERECQTTGKRAMAERTRRDAEGMLSRYRGAISDARRKATKERESRAIEAEEEERRLLKEAKDRANADLKERVAEIGMEADDARKELRASVEPLAADIVRQVLQS